MSRWRLHMGHKRLRQWPRFNCDNVYFMSMKRILGGFVHERGVHSDTTSLRTVFASAGHRLPEPFFFGIGEGLGFYYRNGRNLAYPILGGRIGGLELDRRACQATGARLGIGTSTSPRRAYETMASLLEAGKPVVVHVDTYYLEFLRKNAHNGAHSVVVAGVDEDGGIALVADRSSDRLIEVPLARLAEARASVHKPFPPHNRWLEIDVPEAVSADPRTIMGAIGRNATEMLNSATCNVGIGGIYYFATCLQGWNDLYNKKKLEAVCREAYEAIDGDGTGGGFFRHMYAGFLDYAAGATGIAALEEVADGYRQAGAMWARAGKMLLEAGCGCTSLSEASEAVRAIAAKEHELQVSLMTAAKLCCRRK